jgi:hypothetical protein
MQSRWAPRVVFGMLVVYLLIGVSSGLRDTVLRLRAAAGTAGLSAAAVRAQAFGPEYVAAMDQIRRVIPDDQPYLLSYQDDVKAILPVRFDLLPRRAIIRRPPGWHGLGRDCWPAQARWMVVGVGDGRAPLLLEHPPRVPPGCPPAPWMKPR